LQERNVDEGMSGKSLLGILPTGTGKSLCCQVPSLSRYDKTGVDDFQAGLITRTRSARDSAGGLARARVRALASFPSPCSA
jgi:superfamily II DNA/RNA helicase